MDDKLLAPPFSSSPLPRGVAKADLQDLLSRLKEMDELLQFPGVAGHIERATALGISIARSAGNGSVANIAMQVVSEASAVRASPLPLKMDYAKLNELLARLRLLLEQAMCEAR
jgi:hypothetical protein